MKYAVEQRLVFIDFLLAEYGHVGRGAIIDYFGISEATATRDFKEYKLRFPYNMVYNGNDKAYYKTQDFKRVWD